MKHKLRILLADDHPVLREVTRFFLAREKDFDVCAVTGIGPEAIEQTLRHQPDVVLLDLRMPGGLDELEVARQIKAQHPTVEVVVYSSVWRGPFTEEIP